MQIARAPRRMRKTTTKRLFENENMCVIFRPTQTGAVLDVVIFLWWTITQRNVV